MTLACGHALVKARTMPNRYAAISRQGTKQKAKYFQRLIRPLQKARNRTPGAGALETYPNDCLRLTDRIEREATEARISSASGKTNRVIVIRHCFRLQWQPNAATEIS
jgi:hypothetical protein